MPLTPEHDHAYRAFVSREVFAEVLARWNESITRTSTASRKPIALTLPGCMDCDAGSAHAPRAQIQRLES